jgi:hypothetical protein
MTGIRPMRNLTAAQARRGKAVAGWGWSIDPVRLDALFSKAMSIRGGLVRRPE